MLTLGRSQEAAGGIMFVLVEMVDTVRISPWNFHRQLNEAIAEELNKKLANKVRLCERDRLRLRWRTLYCCNKNDLNCLFCIKIFHITCLNDWVCDWMAISKNDLLD